MDHQRRQPRGSQQITTAERAASRFTQKNTTCASATGLSSETKIIHLKCRRAALPEHPFAVHPTNASTLVKMNYAEASSAPDVGRRRQHGLKQRIAFYSVDILVRIIIFILLACSMDFAFDNPVPGEFIVVQVTVCAYLTRADR